jgi:hypothetical protein
MGARSFIPAANELGIGLMHLASNAYVPVAMKEI